ncbi:MAG: integrase core domain-containing protein [Acidimicrobiia bacterium]
MSVRLLIVKADLRYLNVSEFCRQHGVSRKFFYELRARYEEEGEAALVPRSRAPKTVSNRTPEVVEEAIVALRKELDEKGLDAGPATIAFHLPARLEEEFEVPSEATIWRVLGRWGFINPQPEKAPKGSYRRFVAARVNQLWQIDAIEWTLADATEVEVINILDDCSRVLLRAKAVLSCDTHCTVAAFFEAAERWGWPERFLSDRAGEFVHGLAKAVAELGVASTHSRPYHPQTCGKVERLQGTEIKWLKAQPLAQTLEELQTQLDAFAEIYNFERPHRGIGRRFPAQVFSSTPKSGPADRPLDQKSSFHRIKVINGTCSIGKRRYDISMGAAYTGEMADIIITGTSCHIFIEGRLIRALTLDPRRRMQPLYDRPGHPGKVRKEV